MQLHELLTLTRPLFVLDTETTGTDRQQSRIVELGFQQWTAEGMVKEYRTLINPGIPIPPVATYGTPDGKYTGHGITDEMVKDAYTFEQLAPNLAKGFTDCDFGGQQIRFDLAIVGASMIRAKVPWSYAEARVVDSLALERLAVPRTLSDLYEKYAGQKLEGAHGALADVKASAAVIAGQLTQHLTLPRDLDQLHQLQWPGLIDNEGWFRFVEGVPTMMRGKHRDKPLTIVYRDDRSYLAWLGGPKSDSSDEVKRIANDAAAGKFPVEKVRS